MELLFGEEETHAGPVGYTSNPTLEIALNLTWNRLFGDIPGMERLDPEFRSPIPSSLSLYLKLLWTVLHSRGGGAPEDSGNGCICSSSFSH